SLNGTYGAFAFDTTTGAWTYTLDDTRPATQALIAGQATTDALTVASADNSASHDIVVNITGANDTAAIGVVAGGDYAASEAGGVNNTTAGDPSASGQLTVSDVDAGQDHFATPASLNGTYGTFTFDTTTGAWTYTLDDSRAATQALIAGQATTDTLTVASADNSASHDIVVNITGANDTAAIGVVAGGDYAASEAGGVNNTTAGDPSASGQLTVSDVDAGQDHFATPASLNGTYGTFTFDTTTGAWTYTLDDSRAATQALIAGQATTDTLTVASADNSASHDIVVNITGANDTAAIGVVAGGDYAASEAGGVNNTTAGDPSASGQLTVSDVDAGQDHFATPASLNGTYGTFTFDTTTGAWTYTLDDSRAATQALIAGQATTDTLTVASADNSASHDIVVNITGANDTAAIGVVAGGDYAASEAGGVNNTTAGDPSASGQLTVSDVDAGQDHFATPASLNGTYGTFTFDTTTGAWTYTLDDSRAATQALIAGQATTDTLTVASADNSASHDIVVNITGANDTAAIGVVAGGDYAASEAGGVNNTTAGDPSASGQLTVSDVDAGQDHFATPASLSGTYGTFTFDTTTGAWTYTLDDSRAATQALIAGQATTDTLTVASADNSASHDIVVNITGANDTAAIGVVAGGDYAASEAGGVNNTTAGDPSASGQLTVSDVDAGQDHFATPASLNGTYGTFTFDTTTGAWTYTLDDSRAATQALIAGQATTDTLTVASADNSASHDIVVNITGANDTAAIGVVAGGDYAASEAGGVNNTTAGDPSASGLLTVSDVDAGQDHFATPASLNGTY
ncbi:beta strand repeat-containing protein, partial [Bradyrhizobium ivorense]|uniref:beta strand repeat-containing protein n=1 Tax=Bradyrhizobium ivorense TaxID=2511166 RepID=UPI001AEDD883